MKQPTIEELKELARKALIAYSPDDNLGYRKDLKDAKLYNVTVGNMAHFAHSVLHPVRKPLSELWKDHESCLKIFNFISGEYDSLSIRNSNRNIWIESKKWLITINYKGSVSCLFNGIAIHYNPFSFITHIRSLGYDVIPEAI